MRLLDHTKSHPPVTLWLLLRLLSIPVALLAFLYDRGGRTATHLRDYLLAPWTSYDTYYYVRIVQTGYHAGDITSGFHPLYPWTSAIVATIVRDPLVSLLLVSSIAGMILTIAFYRLASLDCDQTRAWTATALFLCWPVTVAIFVPYTEALFLLLAVCCLFAARNRHFWLAGLLGGLAALTRQHGIFLVLLLAWELWEASDRDWRQALLRWRAWSSILLVPLGYAAWILYRAIAISDVKPDFSSAQGFIFSVMVSPTAHQVYKDQQFLPPWVALWRALVLLWRGGLHWSAYGDAIISLVFVAMFAFSWRYLRTSYKVYSLTVILFALSYHTGTRLDPYISLPRHMLPAFPVFIGVAVGYRFRRLAFVLCVLAICQALLLCCFVWQVWVL